MLATAVADIVFGSLSRHTIMTGKLSRRGLRIGRHYGVDPFTTVRVGQIMSAPVVTLPATTTVAGARQAPDDDALVALQAMVDEGVDHLPVLDGGRLAGICTRTDLLKVRHALGDHERVQVGLTWRRSAKLDP
jgi:CBS domain-containing protein